MSENYSANPGKNLVRTVDGVDYLRIPVKTHLITKDDDMVDVVLKYPKDKLRAGDILFISEKAVACTQSRAIPMEDIRPRKLAITLSRYVTKTPAGIGLGIPETMEMALRECGTLRILFAAFCSVVGKIFGQRGWFYNVAGPKARGIDGPALRPLRGPHPRRPHGDGQASGTGAWISRRHCGHQRPGGQHPGLLREAAHDGLAGPSAGRQPPGPGGGVHSHGHSEKSVRKVPRLAGGLRHSFRGSGRSI